MANLYYDSYTRFIVVAWINAHIVGDVMGRFNRNNKFLNYIFSNEEKITESTIGSPERWLKVIAETYEAAKQKKLEISDISSRRFRKKESYIYTCIMTGISPAKYYRLLSIFFKIAEKKIEKIFSNSEK